MVNICIQMIQLFIHFTQEKSIKNTAPSQYDEIITLFLYTILAVRL